MFHNRFRTSFSESIFRLKYSQGPADTWDALAERVVDSVVREKNFLSKDESSLLEQFIKEMKFIPGGRYLYYAGRPLRFYNNCYLLKVLEDTREEWSNLAWRAMACLMTGGGIGIDYSIIRPSGKALKRTGGVSSGPISLMSIINEIGRNVIQGGSRRSAIYASLHWSHEDVEEFLKIKNWDEQSTGLVYSGGEGTHSYYSYGDLKRADFNAPCVLDMTNISVNYDETIFRHNEFDWNNPVFLNNCLQAMRTGEPGFSFNFFDRKEETLRNACTEVVSSDDSDCCNLGSVNIGRIKNKAELEEVVRLASKFLVCGSIIVDTPYEKVYQVKEKNRRIGLGLMGVHEWLLQRKYKYEVVPELREWLQVYKENSEKGANELCDRLGINRPVAYRAIAPTGSIGIMASTTTGIEPLYAVAYKRRYVTAQNKWKFQYVVDAVADHVIKEYSLDPDSIETASDLAVDYERRIKFQADVQEYVDMAISSTINLPKWGSKHNNEDLVKGFAQTLAKYATRLRGFTCYPDGARGGQPLEKVSYHEALKHKDVEFVENDICTISNKGGFCGS